MIVPFHYAYTDGLGVGDRSLAHEHGGRLTLEVEVRLATDVDGDANDDAAGEVPRQFAGVVVGDAGATVASDAEALAGDHELAGLGLDAAFADLGVVVPERPRPGGDTGRVLSILFERSGEDHVFTGPDLGVGDDLVLGHPDEVVD